jgi:signal recognition particle receptor subunit beta
MSVDQEGASTTVGEEDEETVVFSTPPTPQSAAAIKPASSTWQRSVLQKVLPILPPPVVRGVERIDRDLHPYVGPDATVTVTATLLTAYFVLLVTSRLLFGRSRGKAIQDNEDDRMMQTMNTNDFDATVLLVGPIFSGKTRMFYELCRHKNNIPTLMSLKANVGICEKKIRYMDWPGYAPLDDPTVRSVLASNKVRIVLVVDATQPVAAAAEILYELLELAKAKKLRTQTIFVACHKQDIAKAKNDRRIKIQLRTELERLLTVRAAADESTWWPAGEPLELDELKFVKLTFCGTACDGKGSPELREFCQGRTATKKEE